MIDADFDFIEKVGETRPKKGLMHRRKTWKPQVPSFTPENYDMLDDEQEVMGTMLVGVPDGEYILDEECGKLIELDEWMDHILEEHVELGRALTAGPPSKETKL